MTSTASPPATRPMCRRSPAGGASCSVTRRSRSSRDGSRSQSRKAAWWRWSGSDRSPRRRGGRVIMAARTTRESTHGPIPSQSVVHSRDLNRARRKAAGADDLQRAAGDLPRRGRDRRGAHRPLPHRKAPLSSGEVVGSDIQCGYHGIRFAADGTCTHVPGNVPVGRDFRARCFPAREVHGLIFVWFGEASLADPALIPDFDENVKPGWTGVHGMLYVTANYQLLIDNILDLTHVVFVHKTTLAGGGVAETPLRVEIDGDVVRAQRLMHNVDTAPIYKAARNLHGKI